MDLSGQLQIRVTFLLLGWNEMHEFFNDKYEVVGECFLWTKALHGKTRLHSYGYTWYINRRWKTHRLSYELNLGPIPEGMSVLHSCDNPRCINPEHLVLGTHDDNMRHLKERGRANRKPVNVGDKNASAKLSEKQIVDIRASVESRKVLADLYGVSYSNICLIKSGRSWRHVKDVPPQK